MPNIISIRNVVELFNVSMKEIFFSFVDLKCLIYNRFYKSQIVYV